MKDIKSVLQNSLLTTQLITLSTISEDIPWSSPMYFTFDSDLNIYVLVDTNSQHMKNVFLLQKAAIIVQDTDFNIQIVGNVEIISKKEVPRIRAIYQKLHRMHTEDMEFINQAINLDWRILQVIPNEIVLLNDATSRRMEFRSN